MGDITKPIAQWISSNIPLSIGIVLFIFCLLFEISKVKIYPLRWLWKLISWPFRKIDEQRTNSFKNLINELKTDIDVKLTTMSTESNNNCSAVKACFTELEKRFDKLDAKQAETEIRLDLLAAARIKNHVLNFARQCRKGEPHSHEDFTNLFRENEEYEILVEKYNWKNDVYKHDYAYIQRVYDECNNKGDFGE
jgi:hypothetical protein